MNIKKAVSAFAAAMAAVTMFSVSAFAETTIRLDSEYAGNWGAGAYIPQDELEAIDGDVKVTLDVETVEFVVPAYVIEGLTDKDGECGIGFQVCNVIVKSATLEAGEPEKAARIIDNDNVIPYCFGEYEMPAEELSCMRNSNCSSRSICSKEKVISKSQSAAFFSKMM